VPLLRRVATLRVSLRSWLRHRFAALQAAHANPYTPKAELSRYVQIGRLYFKK
jgi:deferrochelatase/peroxidase EfeB